MVTQSLLVQLLADSSTVVLWVVLLTAELSADSLMVVLSLVDSLTADLLMVVSLAVELWVDSLMAELSVVDSLVLLVLADAVAVDVCSTVAYVADFATWHQSFVAF